MSTTLWTGNALAVTQVSTVSIGTYDATTTYKVTIGVRVVSVLGQGGTATTTATALAAALAASTDPEFQEVTWTSSGATVIGTSNTAGVPFTATTSVSGGTGTIGIAATVAATGPNFWTDVNNWSGGALPVNGDTVLIQGNGVSILYGLSQSAVTLAELDIAASYTGQIGLMQYASNYAQYRPTFLAIGATLVNIGYGAGSGSGLIRLNTGAVDTAISVASMATSTETGLEAFCWHGVGSTPTLSVEVLGGSVGIDISPGDSGASTQVYMSGANSSVRCGPASVINLTMSGGSAVLYGSMGSIVMNGGNTTVYGISDLPDITLNGGTLFWNSSGTLNSGAAFVPIATGATLDFSQDFRPKVVAAGTILQCSRGATINDPNACLSAVSGTIQIVPFGCSVGDLVLNLGIGRTLQL